MQHPIGAGGGDRPAPISLSFKILYGIGEIANAIKTVTFSLYAVFFVTVVLGLPGAWIGLVGFVALLWDAVVDPYIGHWSDGEDAGQNRFRLMVVGAATSGIGYWAFFSPPDGLSTVALCSWLLLANLAMRTATSVFSIPYYAIGNTLSQDYHERTSIAGVRGAASAIGTILTGSLSFILFFPNTPGGADPKLDRAGYAEMGFAFAIVMTAVAFCAVLAAASRPMEESAAPPARRPTQFFASVLKALRAPSMRIVLLSISLAMIALSVNGAMLLHFVGFYVKVSDSVAMSALSVAFFSSGLIGTFFWIRVAQGWDKHRLYMISTQVSSVLLFAVVYLFGEGHVFGVGDLRPLIVCYAIAGFFNSILWFIPASMLADVADEGEMITGVRQDSSLFGILSLVQQVATGSGVLLTGLLVDQYLMLPHGGAQPTDESVFRIGVVYGIIPAALFMAAAVTMSRYKLTRTRVAAIRGELNRRDNRSTDGARAEA